MGFYEARILGNSVVLRCDGTKVAINRDIRIMSNLGTDFVIYSSTRWQILELDYSDIP